MGMPAHRIPTQHKQASFYQGSIMRSPSPFFAPPVPSYMREPGTNYVTIITAPGPHTTGRPGTTGGKASFGAFHPQSAQKPLTHKGG
jgi:hypothetical protein